MGKGRMYGIPGKVVLANWETKKAMVFDSNEEAIAYFHGTLAQPEWVQDWTIVPEGNVVHIDCANWITQRHSYELMAVREFKQKVVGLLAENKLNCVTVLTSDDFEENGGVALTDWLNSKRQVKRFELVSLFGPQPKSTAQWARDMQAAYKITHN
jgi:hypothetical protein